MTVEPFAPAFSDAYSRAPGDEWTVHLAGDANAAKRIVKDSLVIRMGKDKPEHLGQADAGVCTFETAAGDHLPMDGQVIVQRNGQDVWTGTITDDVRDFAPSGSRVSVNAAGPRRLLNGLPWEPVYDQDNNTTALFPPFNVLQPLTLVDVVAALRTWAVKYGVFLKDNEAGDTAYKIGRWWLAKGSPLRNVSDLLDGAANVTFGNIWETRDGSVEAVGNAYYRNPPDADRIVIDASEIDVPVRTYATNNTINAWDPFWIIYDPTFGDVRQISGVQDTRPHGGPFNRPVPGVTFAPAATAPVWIDDKAGGGGAGDMWQHLITVASRSVRSIDEWPIDQARARPETWDRLVTAPLGAPIRFTGLPAGLFADNHTVFDGFLFGWRMKGTSTITLTVVDRTLIV